MTLLRSDLQDVYCSWLTTKKGDSMAKQGVLEKQVSNAKVRLSKNFSGVKPTVLYFLRADDYPTLPFKMKMTLPAGDYFVVAQAFVRNSSNTPPETFLEQFGCLLTYYQGSTKVFDLIGGPLPPLGPPHNVLLSVAFSADVPRSIEFGVGATSGNVLANGLRLTAFRVGSVAVIPK